MELRSLNGKTTDLRMRLPNYYKEKEIQLRKIILDEAVRGKLDFNLTIDSDLGDTDYTLNISLFKKYFNELNLLRKSLNMEQADIMQTIIRIPNVIKPNDEELDNEEWNLVKDLTYQTLDSLKKYRCNEGLALKQDLKERINSILQLLEEVPSFEDDRMSIVKERMYKNLNDSPSVEQLDTNRFEQELIYYLEKLDINEEKVRLKQNCKFFKSEVKENHSFAKGKKLSFISQEIGREINTLGAKAQHAEIQRLVVLMKDELEKIKEQVANIV